MVERLLFPHKKDKGITLQEFAELMISTGVAANVDYSKEESAPDAVRLNNEMITHKILEHIFPDGFEL